MFIVCVTKRGHSDRRESPDFGKRILTRLNNRVAKYEKIWLIGHFGCFLGVFFGIFQIA